MNLFKLFSTKKIATKKRKRKALKRAGLPPGSLVYVGDSQNNLPVKITKISYTESGFNEKEYATPEECLNDFDGSQINWINLDGIHNVGLVEKIGSHFNLHSLVLEDILHTTQRPKIEEHENFIFIVLKMLEYDSAAQEIKSEQISLILGDRLVLSFQENIGDIFNPIRERIRQGKGRVRKYGADYLTYTLIDAIVDHYFLILENIAEKIEQLEDLITEETNKNIAQTIHALKREAILIRKAIWPLREVVSVLERHEFDLVKRETKLFLRDVYDHTIQVIDAVESYRDIISSMLEIYLATISNRMNEVMKVLTIISTIFIPLTFVVGIYGMNFEFMPEIKWRYAYPVVMIGMLLIALGMLAYFRKRKWI